jgi:predicted enzyme related to lactoylglutathione lyase
VDPRRVEAHARHRAAREDPGGVGPILTRIDHVEIGAADLAAGIDAYRRIGFDVDDGGAARCADDWLQLVHGREGLKSIALASSSIERDRVTADYLSVVAARRLAAGRHPNGAQRIERVYIAVTDLAAALKQYSSALGVPAKMERGTVINADMAIFQLGPTGLGLAYPVGPGVAADALARGPGPFQVLFRTSGMDAAAKWMADHGVPPPVRGIRNTGEHAMLVPPAHACGVYIGFVGPA